MAALLCRGLTANEIAAQLLISLDGQEACGEHLRQAEREELVGVGGEADG